MKIKYKKIYIEQLMQLITVTSKNDLLCEKTTNDLIRCNYAKKLNNYYFISENGIIALCNLKVIED